MHPEAAGHILDAKMADIQATKADLVIISNTGCHLQIIAGVRKADIQARVMHVAEVLELSYLEGEKNSSKDHS
jgi:glycolate oxidase iron-sulfur subunit